MQRVLVGLLKKPASHLTGNSKIVQLPRLVPANVEAVAA